jgi:hypothetical protein
MATPYLYRALFPPHFTPRTTGYDGSERQWNTLELPNVRLMGGLWSFGVVLQQDSDKTLALRLLLEEETPHPLAPLERHATPILFRAQVHSLLQANEKDLSATRMSLLAVDTISSTPTRRATGQLNNYNPSELGFADGTRPSASTPLLLAPFGGQPTPTSNMVRSFLPAMQLLQGSVRYVANGKYLARLRKRFGLQVPATNSGLPSNEIVLLPDGFCLTGARPVPWMDGDINGWFKATVRLDLAKDGSVRGLTPWIDPLTQFDPWTAATRRLETILRSSDEAPGRPAWMQVSPNVPLLPEHLFWQETQADGPLLGPISQTLTLACPGLDIRLSSRPDGADALSTLSLQAKRLQCRQSAKGATRFEFTAVLGDTAAPQGVNARYVFSTVKERVESYSFSERTRGGEQPAPTLTLALPVIETADVLRQAMGLPAPAPGSPLGLLWTFTPVTGGWLHWPLANATAGNLAPLLNKPQETETPAPAAPTELFGSLAFGNRPAHPGHDQAQRTWSLSLSALATGTVKLEIDRDACVITAADVQVQGGNASFDGLFLVTPFAQTAERLLPDHTERALCTVGLRGVSPSQLRGIEAQLWQQGQMGIRLEAAVNGFKITANDQGQAQVSADAKVSLTTHLDITGWKSSLRPWMWLAHRSLPTVQSQPLALTGAQGTQPSGVRALAPLVVANAPREARLKYEAPLAFDAPAMDLTLQGEWSSHGPFTAATFTRPQAWPLQEATARNEIVMAVTTLPSVSLRVGEPGVGDLALDARWSTCTTDGVHACFRHDLALRDARYASATPPPAPAPDLAGKDQNPAPAAVASFTPLPGNGPYSPPPKVGEPVLTNGWDRVWRDLNRRAALAALDDRSLLRQVAGNSWSLTGVFGEQSFQLTQPPTLSEKITLDSSQQRLVSIGDYQFSLTKQPGFSQHFPGLPASDDLVGLAGSLVRGALDVDLRFGVAHLFRKADGTFTDQYGLASKAVEQGEVTLRTVQCTAASTAAVRLLTLNAPLVVNNAGGATFRCVDVPVDATDKQGVLARFGVASGPTGLEQRINSARQSNNHLAGFRWSLADPRFPGSALIIVDGLVFEAMELNTIVQTGSGRPTSIKLLGRLRVPLSEAEHELPVARGLVTLTLTPAHTGTGYVAELSLDEGPIELPFAGSATSLVPVASLKVMPVMGDTVGAEMKFAIGAQNYTVKGTIKHLAQGLVFQNDATLTSPSTAPEHLWPTRFEAMLPAALASGSTIVGVTNAAVTLEYAVQLGTDGARLGGELVYDLVRQATTVSELHFAFSDSIQVPVRVVRPDDIALDRGVMALCWSTSTSTVKLLGGLTMVKAVGTTLAALAPTAGPGGLPAFTVLDRRLRAHFTCTGESGATLELKLDDVDREDALSPRALGYRLHGQMSLNNALSWPVIVETREKDRLLADFSVKDDHFKHDVTLAFEGQAISPAAFHRHDKVHDRVPLMVEAHHRLTRYLDQKQESIKWTVYQVVWLSSTTAFSKALEERVAPPRPLDIKRSRTGFAPFTGNVAKSLRAAPYSYHTEVVNGGGLAGLLADGVSKTLAGQEALAVEFSSHALLAFTLPRASATTTRPPAPRPLLLGLAGFGLWAGEAKPFVPPPPLKYLLESRSEPGKPSQFWLPPGDGYEAHRLPASEQAIGRLARSPVTSRAVADRPSAATAFDPRKAHRAVFQPVVRPAGSALPAPELPAAGAAFILSALFEDNKEGALADHAPQAYGFAGSGRIDAVDFFTGLADASEDDLGRATELKPSVYANSLRRFLEYAAANGIVAANTPLAPVQTLTVEVQTLSRDGCRIIGVETRELQVGSDEVEAQLLQTAASWGVRAVQLRAPWAHVALLTIRRDDFGLLPAATAPYTYLLKVGARDDLPVVPRYPVGKYSLPPQPQRETLSIADANTRLLAGYAPLRVHPVLLSSDPMPMALDNAAAPRLMATGVETSWTLGNGAHAMLAGEQHDSYWLADRETVAFRPFAPPPAKGHYDLTFALPPGFSAATPRGLLPASHALGKPAAQETPVDCALANVRDTTRAFAPAYSSATRISLRPGAWSASRMGLALDRDNLANPAIPLRVKASEMPVHLRQPRPPVLGVNDRPRASAYEPGHLALGTSQTVLVHGERATRVGAGSVPVGLDRVPRSRWASTLQMTAPTNGILRTGWTGSITLQNIADHGDPPNGARSLEVAALVIGTERFNLPVDNASLPDLSGQAPVTLQGFIRSGYPATALEAVRGLPAATPVTLELVIRLPVEQGSQPLRRRVSFALITGGAVQSDIETPVYARFEDPEYNDRLTAIPQVNRQSSPRNPANDFVMAADRTKLAPGERIEAVLALRPAAPANPICPGFEATGPEGRLVAAYDLDDTRVAQEVSLVLERIRVDEPTARRVVETPGQESAITGGIFDASSEDFRLKVATLSGTCSPITALPFSIDTARLSLADTQGEPSPVFQAGDILMLRVSVIKGKVRSRALVSLAFNLLATPEFIPNPASFALLTLDGWRRKVDGPDWKQGAIQVGVALYTDHPTPSHIELVDPLDLLDGVVRYRATYYWRTFSPDALAGSRRYALQKINAVGGTWLPDEPQVDWPGLE